MRNVQKEVRDILKEISDATGYDYQLIEDIYVHEFEFTSDQITKGERNNPDTFENILLKHFGSFVSSRKHINKLNEIQAKKDKDCL